MWVPDGGAQNGYEVDVLAGRVLGLGVEGFNL
jgi:hypothetical protein